MKQRLLTAIGVAILGAVVGIGIAFQLKMPQQAFGIALATSAVGFFLGLVFRVG